MARIWIALLAVAVGGYFALIPRFPVPAPQNSAVFITGCSSGIGKDTALTLVKQGYVVFAGVRKEEDAKSLLSDAGGVKGAGGAVIPVIMDVRNASTVEGAAAFVRSALEGSIRSPANGRKLAGLVNNAGVGQIGAVETITSAQVRSLFDVNVFGVITVTRSFVPLLREHGPGSRVINIGSISGKYSPPVHGIYGATKYAVEALSDALRIEVHDFGIAVTCVEPGIVGSVFIDKLQESTPTFTGYDSKVAEVYGRLTHNFLKAYADFANWGITSPVQDVASGVLSVMQSNTPPARFTIGIDAAVINFGVSYLPTVVMDAITRLVTLAPVPK